MKQYAGIYTGKYSVGDYVNTKDTYPTGKYYGSIISILQGQSFNNAYGVHLKDEYHDDGSPIVTYFSEDQIELEQSNVS